MTYIEVGHSYIGSKHRYWEFRGAYRFAEIVPLMVDNDQFTKTDYAPDLTSRYWVLQPNPFLDGVDLAESFPCLFQKATVSARTKSSRRLVRAVWAKCIGPGIRGWIAK